MIRALCIDDDPDLLDIAKIFLERDGVISVEPSTSAMDAMVMLETRNFDVIVCDYQMPKMDGIQFLKSIRYQGRTTPFILFTGKGREDVVIDALNNGADFYLQKGGDPKIQFVELANIIKRSVSQRQAINQLRELEEIYEKFFKDNVESMILLDSSNGSIVNANHAACNFYGYSREELLKLKIDDLAITPETDDLKRSSNELNGNGTIRAMKHRLSNGEVRYVELRSGMLCAKGVTRSYIIVHDITERKQMEEHLIQLNEVLRSINSIICHDTLNELTVLNGSLEMYKHTQSEKFLTNAIKAMNRSMEMIKRMKELENITLSGGPLKTFDLAKVTEGVCKGYAIDFKIEGSCNVLADDALSSAIDNIVRNAIIHGKADRIYIQIKKQDGKYYMRIADNGIGIPDELKDKVFQEGFSHGINGGTGLGLYLVRKAVERYGGEVWVEDNVPHGATFVISLPEARPAQST